MNPRETPPSERCDKREIARSQRKRSLTGAQVREVFLEGISWTNVRDAAI